MILFIFQSPINNDLPRSILGLNQGAQFSIIVHRPNINAEIVSAGHEESFLVHDENGGDSVGMALDLLHHCDVVLGVEVARDLVVRNQLQLETK
jgi:hypothetical protein